MIGYWFLANAFTAGFCVAFGIVEVDRGRSKLAVFNFALAFVNVAWIVVFGAGR